MPEKKTRKSLEDGLQLSGNVKSLLRRDIVVSVGEVHSTLVSGGVLPGEDPVSRLS